MSDFLSNYGDIKHCYEIHKRTMQKQGLPYLSYTGFRRRIVTGRPVYLAIHQKCETKKRGNTKGKTFWRRLKKKLINLFKRN